MKACEVPGYDIAKGTEIGQKKKAQKCKDQRNGQPNYPVDLRLILHVQYHDDQV